MFYNPEIPGNLDSTLMTLTPFAHGDFNGDGYEDFAMGMNTTLTFADLSKGMGCNAIGTIPGRPRFNIGVRRSVNEQSYGKRPLCSCGQ